jgi:signal transduction histidine kinase
MDHPGVEPRRRWYRRLQVQLWLWAIVPVTLVMVVVTLSGVSNHESTMHHFVFERDLALARLLGRQIDDALLYGTLRADGLDLGMIITDARVGQRGAIYVVDSAGRVIFHPNREQVGQDLSGEPVIRQALSGTEGSGSGHTTEGARTLVSFASVSATGWRVLVDEPEADVIVPVLRFTSFLPPLVALAVALSLGVIYFSMRTIARPLQRLADEAAHITGGELGGLQRDVGGVEEIRQLQRALVAMVERVRSYQESVRDYIEGITEGQEHERARLSRELHDDTMQELVAMAQRLQLAQRALQRGDAPAADASLQQTRALCEGTLAGLRRTLSALRPVYLEDLGLMPALESLTQEVGDTGSVELVVRGEPRRLDAEIELAAYRVAQESLSNARRHAQAQHITMAVAFEEHALTLTVTDDGVGFEAGLAPDVLTRAGHLGLVGMRERALLLGGRLTVESGPGKGTRVSASFPLSLS